MSCRHSTVGLVRRRARTVLLPAAALLVLAGCSSDDGGRTAAPGAPSSPAASAGARAGGGGMAMGGAPECPAPPSSAAAPRRVVTLDTGAAAFLVELGLGDRIVGTSGTDFSADFDGDVRARLDALPVLDERVANRESVIAAQPDLVTGISVFEFGAFDGTASVQQLQQAGAASLVACDTTPGGATTDLSATYRYVEQLAEVFQVPEEGRRLVREMQAEVAAATAPYAGRPPVRVLTLTAAPTGGQGVNTSGGGGLANGVLTLAGGENIAGDVGGDFAQLSAEVVRQRDPQAIVVVTGITPESPQALTDAIRSSPLLAQTTAVREDRLVVVPQTRLLSPSLLNGRAVADIARGLHRAAG